MRQSTKQFAKRLLDLVGLEVRRKSNSTRPFRLLEAVLEAFASSKPCINVVQVGANDGSRGDPIYDFLQENQGLTNALLIEPQPEILGYLRAAYAGHPGISIFNGAIGRGGTLVLHRIRPEAWSSFHAPYLRGAPAYRAPSGLTSARREHVLAAASKYLDRRLRAEEAIEEIEVPCMPLRDLVVHMGFPTAIDLLQVDVEGADDEVIYACNIDELQPALINFESKFLGEKKRAALEGYLERRGYKLHHWSSSDTLAILRPGHVLRGQIRQAPRRPAAPREEDHDGGEK